MYMSVTPAASAPAATLATMSRLASWVILLARAARRLTSRPDMGFTQSASLPLDISVDSSQRCSHSYDAHRRNISFA